MWVATDIVKQPSYEVAAQHVTQWIKVAEKCLNLNNFASMVRQPPTSTSSSQDCVSVPLMVMDECTARCASCRL